MKDELLKCPCCDEGKLILVEYLEFLMNEKGECSAIYICDKCGESVSG